MDFIITKNSRYECGRKRREGGVEGDQGVGVSTTVGGEEIGFTS